MRVLLSELTKINFTPFSILQTLLKYLKNSLFSPSPCSSDRAVETAEERQGSTHKSQNCSGPFHPLDSCTWTTASSNHRAKNYFLNHMVKINQYGFLLCLFYNCRGQPRGPTSHRQVLNYIPSSPCSLFNSNSDDLIFHLLQILL